MTWAEVAGKKQPKKKTPQASPNHLRLQVPDAKLAKIAEMERRTMVIRKVAPSTTPASILQDLQKQCKRPLGEILESVVREPLDRRRFYLRFHSVELKRGSAKNGFTIGETVIPPQLSDVQGYIPEVPHYLDRDEILQILSLYGDVVKGDFVRFEETNIRCGGFSFELNLHENKKLPSTISIMSDTFEIKLKDDLQQCSYCDKYGHIVRHCLKKKEEIVRRANKEHAAQFGDSLNAPMDVAGDQVQPAADPPPSGPSQQTDQSANTVSLQSGIDVGGIPPSSPAFVPHQVLKNATTSQTKQPQQTTSSVAFVSGGQLQMEHPGSSKQPDASNDPFATQELSYPSSYEQQEQHDNEVQMEDPKIPSKRRRKKKDRKQKGNMEEGYSDDSSSDVETPPPTPKTTGKGSFACFLPPVKYVKHPTHPYVVRELKLKWEEPPRLSKEQNERFSLLFKSFESLSGEELNEYHKLRIMNSSYLKFIQDALVPPFKRLVHERWDIHHPEVQNEYFQEHKISIMQEDDIRNIYLQCCRRVRADLEQTDIFRRNFTDCCLSANLMLKFVVTQEYIDSL